MTYFYPAKEIIPGLWIGSAGDAADAQFMNTAKIGFIVNCSKDLPFSFPEIPGIRVAVHDHPVENFEMLRRLPGVVRAIDKKMRANVPVLVHCYAGISRSATVVAAYLMCRYGLSKKDAIALVKSMKSETFQPRVNFERALSLYDYIKSCG